MNGQCEPVSASVQNESEQGCFVQNKQRVSNV